MSYRPIHSHLPLFKKQKPIAYVDSSRELDRMASRNQTFGSTPINCNEWLEKRAFPKKGMEQALNHSEDILPLLARAKIDHPALYSRIRLDPIRAYKNRSTIKDGEFVVCPFSLQPEINHEIVLIITRDGINVFDTGQEDRPNRKKRIIGQYLKELPDKGDSSFTEKYKKFIEKINYLNSYNIQNSLGCGYHAVNFALLACECENFYDLQYRTRIGEMQFRVLSRTPSCLEQFPSPTVMELDENDLLRDNYVEVFLGYKRFALSKNNINTRYTKGIGLLESIQNEELREFIILQFEGKILPNDINVRHNVFRINEEIFGSEIRQNSRLKLEEKNDIFERLRFRESLSEERLGFESKTHTNPDDIVSFRLELLRKNQEFETKKFPEIEKLFEEEARILSEAMENDNIEDKYNELKLLRIARESGKVELKRKIPQKSITPKLSMKSMATGTKKEAVSVPIKKSHLPELKPIDAAGIYHDETNSFRKVHVGGGFRKEIITYDRKTDNIQKNQNF